MKLSVKKNYFSKNKTVLPQAWLLLNYENDFQLSQYYHTPVFFSTYFFENFYHLYFMVRLLNYFYFFILFLVVPHIALVYNGYMIFER